MVNCVAVFDIGKTYKKLLLFNQDYQIVRQEEVILPETEDPDGFPCEDLKALTCWLRETWEMLEANLDYNVIGLNFTTYGASLVHLDRSGNPVAPLYNYLKPFQEIVEDQFYRTYGEKLAIATETASPALGMLNSGLQLYWLKKCRPEVFQTIAYTLHFPQYLSFLFTGHLVSEYTSLGCHTAMWDYRKNDYHDWVNLEDLADLFPPLRSHHKNFRTLFRGRYIPAGLGVHDSSAALVPYLKQFQEPFLLLSTGTWGVTMNPFARQALTVYDLQRDCLFSLTHDGQPVKASRYFIGNVHEEQVSRLSDHFNKPSSYYKTVAFDPKLAAQLSLQEEDTGRAARDTQSCIISKVRPSHLDLSLFNSYEAAYHQLLRLVVRRQAKFIRLAAEGQPELFKSLLVDGEFSRNEVFMALLRQEFPGIQVQAGETAEGTALGAALLLKAWPQPD